MGREIKFRMYIKSLSEMVGNDEIKGACSGLIKAARLSTGIEGKGGLYLPIDDEDIIFMQYTGLKDKNGREIYEGDIISVNGETAWVTFDDGCFCTLGYLGDGRTYPIRQFLFTGKAIEVIGNIYENPELLEGQSIS